MILKHYDTDKTIPYKIAGRHIRDVRYDYEEIMDRNLGPEQDARQAITQYREYEDMLSDERLVNLFETIIHEMIEVDASDMSIIPEKDQTIVKFRIEEKMIPYRIIHKGAHKPFVAYIQYLAGLEVGNFAISEIDGRIQFSGHNFTRDFRVAQSPSNFGAMISFRQLKSSNLNANLDRLGLPEHTVKTFRRIMKQKEGLVLLVGSTRSGKSTTLATGIMEVNDYFDYTLNILTIERPIEYTIPGVVQHNINTLEGVNYDFPKAIQTMLRQDPDQILVGEINDPETAKAVARAAGTGHLVYSTLHANSVLEVYDALKNYELDDRDILQTLRLVIYQSLEPKLCPHCHIQRVASVEEKRWMDKYLQTTNEIGVLADANPDGCDHCTRGYKGLVLVSSMLEANREYRSIYEKDTRTGNISTDELQERLMNTEGVNYRPITTEVFRLLKEKQITIEVAQKLVAG